MRNGSCLLLLPVIVLAGSIAVPARGQQAGSIDFVARVQPTGGRPEPVRQLTFYLLRKSFTGIRKEADAQEPEANLEEFIEKLKVSDGLRAWMKKHKSVELSGPDFIRMLDPDAILGVPEFFNAYMQRNAGDLTLKFPKPKYHESDKQKHPEKYEKQVAEYHEALRKFIQTHPQSLDGIDISLADLNPGQRWARMESERKRRAGLLALRLAQTRYLAGKSETDLEGRGSLRGIAPGTYWLSTLGMEAEAGDARLRWDIAVTVRPGQITWVELSNVNAVLPRRLSD